MNCCLLTLGCPYLFLWVLKSIHPSWLVQSSSEKTSPFAHSFCVASEIPLHWCYMKHSPWSESSLRAIGSVCQLNEGPLESSPLFQKLKQFENSADNLQGPGALTMCCLIVSLQVTWPRLLWWEKTPAPLPLPALLHRHRVGGVSWGHRALSECLYPDGHASPLFCKDSSLFEESLLYITLKVVNSKQILI